MAITMHDIGWVQRQIPRGQNPVSIGFIFEGTSNDIASIRSWLAQEADTLEYSYRISECGLGARMVVVATTVEDCWMIQLRGKRDGWVVKGKGGDDE